MAKRILLLSSRADYGGGPRHIEMLLEKLKGIYQFHVACPEEPPYWDRFRKVVGNRMVHLPHRQMTFSSLRTILQYVQDHSIDLIHSHGKGAGLYAKIIKMLTGKKWIHTPHGIHLDKYNWLTKIFYRFYENFIFLSPDMVIYVSQEERQKALLERIWQRAPFVVIPNGVPIIMPESRKLFRCYGRSLLGLENQDKVVITFSRFDYQKNMREAFLIAQSLPEIIFVWVGDGPERKEFESEINTKEIKNIKIANFYDDPMPLLGGADVYLSTSRWEGLPLSILESMSLGIPIVASNVVGHKEVVGNNRCGILYSLGKPEKAVDAIKKMFDNEDIYLLFSNSAFLTQASQYSAEIMGKGVSKIYQDVLGVF